MAEHVRRRPERIVVFTNGSGDATYNYVEVLCLAAVAACSAVTWSLLDRRRRAHARLNDFLRTFVRYSLAFMVLG